MKLIYAEIELINGWELENARRNMIDNFALSVFYTHPCY